MELTYLYYFKVIAEKGNMSRAAESLHVSQPALSKTISKLESSLGVTLFERRKGRINLSPIGSQFYSHIARAFENIEEGQRLIDSYKRNSGSTVVIGSPVADILNTLLRNYLSSHKQESLQISQFLYPPETLQTELLSGRMDFALSPIPFYHPEIHQFKLMDEEILLAVGHSHPLASKHFVRLADLKDEIFLVNEASFDLRAVTDNCKLVGFEPKVSLCSNESNIIDQMLEAGEGISMIPANVFCERYNDQSPVSALRFTDVEVARFISMVVRKDRIFMDQAQKLYNFAVSYFTDYGQELQHFIDSHFPPYDFGERLSVGLNNPDNLKMSDPTVHL